MPTQKPIKPSERIDEIKLGLKRVLREEDELLLTVASIIQYLDEAQEKEGV